ncbi:MAG: hypothetical protein J6C42_09790, partial [Clostridia bacterium]|nr:hypothetical protein [Clostridia bacterium]
DGKITEIFLPLETRRDGIAQKDNVYIPRGEPLSKTFLDKKKNKVRLKSFVRKLSAVPCFFHRLKFFEKGFGEKLFSEFPKGISSFPRENPPLSSDLRRS